MRLVRCPAPLDQLDHAPLTAIAESLASELGGMEALVARGEVRHVLSAYWGHDDGYYLRIQLPRGGDPTGRTGSGAGTTGLGMSDAQVWFRIDPEIGPDTPLPVPEPIAAERVGGIAGRALLRLVTAGEHAIADGPARPDPAARASHRTVYRVVRATQGADGIKGRTRILGVRAARSLRRPA